ncbi:MAG: carboxylating nicotinate-nucleotide diphosphorylase [Mariniblastus sp.]|nr:carboxylating nicotinate-nucleotide diphosphorylase [Mariniblastus sp.]
MSSQFRIPFDQATRSDAMYLIERGLTEDVGNHDLSRAVDCTTDSLFPESAPATAALVSRESGIVCGVQVCQLAVERFTNNLELRIEVGDSKPIETGQTIATLAGNAREILMLERTCLNFLCRLSAISSLTQLFVARVQGTNACILDTRKTTPGWRRLEKYAVQCGGGKNHRMGLHDAVMIKDNHLAAQAKLVSENQLSIPEAINLSRDWINANVDSLPHGRQTILQIEVDTLKQLEIALPCGPDIILLDNMSPADLERSVQLRDQLNPRVLLEASGGVNLKTVQTIAETGVERISVGGLTHSAGNFDIGLDWG